MMYDIDENEEGIIENRCLNSFQLMDRMKEFFLCDEERILKPYDRRRLNVMYVSLCMFLPSPPSWQYLSQTLDCHKRKLYQYRSNFKEFFISDESFRKSVMYFTSFHCTAGMRKRIIDYIGKY